MKAPWHGKPGGLPVKPKSSEASGATCGGPCRSGTCPECERRVAPLVIKVVYDGNEPERAQSQTKQTPWP